MTSTPIYDQLVAELGEPWSPIGRLTAKLAVLWRDIAQLLWPTEATYRERRAAWHAFCGPLPAPLVLEEPIYDSVVHDLGYPHCSPVEAMVSYVHPRPRRWRNWTRWVSL